MEYRQLGGSGLMVPALTLGTATFTDGSAFREWGSTGVKEATRLLDICLEHGLNMFDTADVYSAGVSETILGKAMAGRRDKVLVSTKATFPMGDGPNDCGSSRHHLTRACEGNLKRLGTDYIDLWQMHAFDAMTPIEEVLRTMDDLQRAGKVRYFGCSNFSGWHLMKSLAVSDRYGWPRYVAHQAFYSLISREFEWELMPLGLDQKVSTVVWAPLSGGRLSGKVNRRDGIPAGSRAAHGGNSSFGKEFPLEHLYDIVDVLEGIAKETNRNVPQVALAWVLSRPTVSTVIIGARDEKQLLANIGAADFRLTPDQARRLDKASQIRPVYPYWHQLDEFQNRNPFPVGLSC